MRGRLDGAIKIGAKLRALETSASGAILLARHVLLSLVRRASVLVTAVSAARGEQRGAARGLAASTA